MISLMFAAVILAAGAPPAQPAAQQPTTVEPAIIPGQKAKPKGADVVCKREPVLGSRMKQRTCMTQADWDQRKIDARDDIEKGQTNIPVR